MYIFTCKNRKETVVAIWGIEFLNMINFSSVLRYYIVRITLVNRRVYVRVGRVLCLPSSNRHVNFKQKRLANSNANFHSFCIVP